MTIAEDVVVIGIAVAAVEAVVAVANGESCFDEAVGQGAFLI